jgi:hypothetical protein
VECSGCSNRLDDSALFCPQCGRSVQPEQQQAVAYRTSSQVTNAPSSDPGVAIAGFVCVIVGLVVPLVGLVGLVLSIVGYRRARREGLPTGLALAGVIVGGIATVLGIVVLMLVLSIGLFASGTTSSSSEQASVSPVDYVGVWQTGLAPLIIRADGNDLVLDTGPGAIDSEWAPMIGLRFVPDGDYYRNQEYGSGLRRNGDVLEVGWLDDAGNFEVVASFSPGE